MLVTHGPLMGTDKCIAEPPKPLAICIFTFLSLSLCFLWFGVLCMKMVVFTVQLPTVWNLLICFSGMV